MFLSHIGFQQAEGIGLITFDPATLVALGELGVCVCVCVLRVCVCGWGGGLGYA